MSDQHACDLDPVDPTRIGAALVATPMSPTVWDDLPDGQHALTSDGTVWQRRSGLWHAAPWWQLEDAEQIKAICADPEKWAFDNGWTRAHIEDTFGSLDPIALPATYPHVDDICRQASVDASGFRDACRQIARLAKVLGCSEAGAVSEVVDAAIRRIKDDALHVRTTLHLNEAARQRPTRQADTDRAAVEAVEALADEWDTEHELKPECMDDDGYRCRRCVDIRALRAIAAASEPTSGHQRDEAGT